MPSTPKLNLGDYLIGGQGGVRTHKAFPRQIKSLVSQPIAQRVHFFDGGRSQVRTEDLQGKNLSLLPTELNVRNWCW